ncbi:hypothetical protein OG897_29955 [Streptomyces sp. NBC_00237]|uniref:hypothetical protein n=1 Tax=Streptomyces sp. NBC_00237 TaxID=2975687 RepID=UPI002251B119|nr:hypothetical protein [Streptomyces sp. NBC_00237]MCX5205665.1 hypothetical protein [Streptomyces sp. NBC_00237]
MIGSPKGHRPQLSVPSGRSGLIGLRERVRQVGGTFTAAATGSGGFRVTAELPVAATEPGAKP